MPATARAEPATLISAPANLGLLGFFKYSTFLVGNLNRLLALAGAAQGLPLPQDLMPEGWHFVLPVGISFFVFQSLSYTIDYYRGKVKSIYEREPMFSEFVR